MNTQFQELSFYEMYIRIIIGHGTYVAMEGRKMVISFHICHFDP